MTNKEYFFQKLTLSDDIDIQGYEEAFNFIFENPDLKNIAISGPYSAGKSSVLASYKNKKKEFKFIHISLAQYHSTNKKLEENIDEPILEGKILNQLIHQIPSEDIPQTNFRIKERIKTSTVFWTTALLVIFVLVLMNLIFFNSWSQYISSLPENWIKSFFGFSANNYVPLISMLFIVIFLVLFTFSLVTIQKNKKIFRKINLQGNEIEIFEESEDSYFDKYLNEVLYLFENVEADVIVFEDLDRFNVNKIFERLKEINILVNLHKKNEKPLRFFYLLRDDIFLSKDRTKFFDYIIPIIPVLDTSNSYDKLYSYLEKGGYQDKFDKSFLQGISLYIDDMRILKNIYNEFVIYIKRINNIELDYNKMLAIILYKNLFPKDFNDLQLNRGFVYFLFNNKDLYIDKETEELQKEISKIEVKIDRMEKENLISLEEFEIIYNHNKPKDRYGRPESYDAKEEERYRNRKEAIQDRNNKNLDKYKIEIMNTEKQILKIKSLPLNEIISRGNIDEVFNVSSINDIGEKKTFDNVKGSEYFYLLKYLVRNGHIDESYNDYMSYFYVGALSRTDKIFLRSITDKKSKDSSYKLDDIPQIISRLNLGNFSQEEILNYDVLQYLLASNIYLNFLEMIMIQLKDTENFKFIESYLDTKKEIPKFVFYLNKNWPEMLSAAVSGNYLTEKEIHLISLYTFYYSSNTTLKKMNKDRNLTDYISGNSEYLNIENPKIDKLIKGFSYLDVLFKYIDYGKSNKELLKSVYAESLYEINFDNLSLILTKLFEVNDKEDLVHKNYTLIYQLSDTNLLDYIEKNFDMYVEVMLSNCNNKITDEEDIVLMLLNNKDVSDQHKKLYINYLETKISEVTDIDDEEIKKELLNEHLIIYSEKNIVDYYKENGLNSILINFINYDKIPLDFSKVSIQDGDELLNQLFEKVVSCNELEDNKYKEMVTTLDYQLKQIQDIKNLEPVKLKILVENKTIPMTMTELSFIRNNFSSQVMYYIKKNIEEYTRLMTQAMFNYNELLEILSSNVEDEIKLELLVFTNQPISIFGKIYPLEVNEYILKNNLNAEELPKLFSTYNQWDSTIQDILGKLVQLHYPIILEISENIPEKLIVNIFVTEEIKQDQKLELLISLIPNIEESMIKKYLSVLKLANYSKLFVSNARPTFKVNSYSKRILEEFKKKEIIKDFKIKPSDSSYYIASLRKQIE